jgi:hypothetical protein
MRSASPLLEGPCRRLQMMHVLTDRLLEDHRRCHSKSYLRFQGRPGQASAYSNLCVQLDARHRAKPFHFNGSRLSQRQPALGVLAARVWGAWQPVMR